MDGGTEGRGGRRAKIHGEHRWNNTWGTIMRRHWSAAEKPADYVSTYWTSGPIPVAVASVASFLRDPGNKFHTGTKWATPSAMGAVFDLQIRKPKLPYQVVQVLVVGSQVLEMSKPPPPPTKEHLLVDAQELRQLIDSRIDEKVKPPIYSKA